MRLSRRAIACAGAASAHLLCALAAGCDPSEAPPVSDNGPPFLVLGVASTQAATVDGGVSLYIQSRGGNYVGIRTHGCTHAFGLYSGVTASCGQTPYYSSAPLAVQADPEEQSCVVEARLYSVCDCVDSGGPSNYESAESAFEWCDSVGTLVTTQFVALGPPGADASDDAAPDANSDASDAGFSGDVGDP